MVPGTKFGGGWWHDSTQNLIRKASSKSAARKQASALIAMIPFPLAYHIGQVFFDREDNQPQPACEKEDHGQAQAAL